MLLLEAYQVLPEAFQMFPEAYEALPEAFQMFPEAYEALPEAYCCRSYCCNMHLDPGQQAPSCTSLPSEAFQLEAYEALPEAYEALPEAYQVLLLEVSSEAYQVLLLEAYWHNSYLAPGQEVQPCTGHCY